MRTLRHTLALLAALGATSCLAIKPPKDSETLVWQSRETCLGALQNGARMPSSEAKALRVASWNVRWFPRGCHHDETCEDRATDVPWLACTIAWMDVDLLSLQEIVMDANGSVAMAELKSKLDELTGGSWSDSFQECGETESQRVGFLWDAKRVTLEEARDVWELNGRAVDGSDACFERMRPGRYARFRTVDGVDFQAIAVHLDSGTGEQDYETRRNALARVATVRVDGRPILDTDADVVVIGDFNTMGRLEGTPVTAAEELEGFAKELAPAYRPLPSVPHCTEYYRGHGGVLDHFVTSAGMTEAARSVTVTGYCAVAGCGDLDPYPAAYERLSDHCPLVLEIRDVDEDP